MFGYIYKSTNMKTGLIYVGQKKSDTFLGDKYVGSGKLLLEAVRQYGKDSFTVELLEEVEFEYQMKEREEYWIGKLNATDRQIGYNLVKNGQVNRNPGLSGEANPFYGKTHTLETRKKMSEIQRMRKRSPLSAETKCKISAKLTGREITWKDKISENAKINPNYGMKGKHLNSEAKKKLSMSKKDWFNSGNHRKEMSSKTSAKWKDPEYRKAHIEGMKGKKKTVHRKECPFCNKMIALFNFDRHVRAAHSNQSL